MREPWKTIWELSEFTGVGLGRFAPFIFGKMIGHSGKMIGHTDDSK